MLQSEKRFEASAFIDDSERSLGGDLWSLNRLDVVGSQTSRREDDSRISWLVRARTYVYVTGKVDYGYSSDYPSILQTFVNSVYRELCNVVPSTKYDPLTCVIPRRVDESNVGKLYFPLKSIHFSEKIDLLSFCYICQTTNLRKYSYYYCVIIVFIIVIVTVTIIIITIIIIIIVLFVGIIIWFFFSFFLKKKDNYFSAKRLDQMEFAASCPLTSRLDLRQKEKQKTRILYSYRVSLRVTYISLPVCLLLQMMYIYIYIYSST